MLNYLAVEMVKSTAKAYEDPLATNFPPSLHPQPTPTSSLSCQETPAVPFEWQTMTSPGDGLETPKVNIQPMVQTITQASQQRNNAKRVSRERQLKINEASRRCRKKKKQELMELKQQVQMLESLQEYVEEHMKSCPYSNASGSGDACQSRNGQSSPSNSTCSSNSSDSSRLRKLNAEHENSRVLPPSRIQELKTIGQFIRMNLALESQSFSPDSISCLPIRMNDWDIRLQITESNFTIHTTKEFPCNAQDVFNFCWENSTRSSNTEAEYPVKPEAPLFSSFETDKNEPSEYCRVFPVHQNDMVFVESKTVGRWSATIHGVPSVMYKSLLCRTTDPSYLMICQQSILSEDDLPGKASSNSIPWLFKRWVVIKPIKRDGQQWTSVESFRTASYATGKRLYSETATYDRFCEHIIRRYSESNETLERLMARDPRFPKLAALRAVPGNFSDKEDSELADRLVAQLLLF